MQQIGGIQLNPKPGTDFNSQYNVPDTGLTNNTTLSNNPLYNLLQVIFQNAKTDEIAHQVANCEVVGSNGLKVNVDSVKTQNAGNKLITQA